MNNRKLPEFGCAIGMFDSFDLDGEPVHDNEEE